MANVPKRYLGDGCYVALAEGKIVLTTENGVEVTNEIVLEPEVAEAFLEFIHRVKLETDRQARRN
jgi:uncharacterized protein YrrD